MLRSWFEATFSSPTISLSMWSPSPIGILMLNFNRSVIGSPGPSASKVFLGQFYNYASSLSLGPSGIRTVNEVELIPMRIGLQEATKLGLHSFIVEIHNIAKMRMLMWMCVKT